MPASSVRGAFPFAVVFLFLTALLAPPPVAGQSTPQPAAASGGITPLIAGCIGATHCVAFYSDEVSPANRGPDDGPFTYVATVKNTGTVTDFIDIWCTTSSAQLPCVAPSPSSVTLAPGATAQVTLGYRTLGLGNFTQTNYAQADLAPAAPRSMTVNVQGLPMVMPITPFADGWYFPGDSLYTRLSHPSGINTATVKMWVDSDSTSGQRVVTSDAAVIRGLTLLAGRHTWKVYACAFNGRCETASVPFTAMGTPASLWALDDSLSDISGAIGISGLLPGGLPLPPVGQRGCPEMANYPEISLAAPPSFFYQFSADNALAGFIFLAGINRGDSLVIQTATIAARTGYVPTTCAQRNLLDYTQYDLNAWSGLGDPAQEPLWSTYPYGDRPLALGPGWLMDRAARVLFAGRQDEHAGRLHAGKGDALVEPTRAPTAPSRLTAGATHRIPAGGPINPASLWVTLNGTLIVSGGAPVRAGVVKNYQDVSSGMFKMPVTDALVHRYNFTTPSADNGGWNEIVASIADSSNRRTAVRARFVVVPPSPKQPLVLTPRRDFLHLSQDECAAFGAFQCGGIMLTQGIPGFVTRDKDRSLHLVYRSGSQAAPTILAHELFVSRLKMAPESLWVTVGAGGVTGQGLLRFAGSKGAPVAPNVVALQDMADEHRIIGAEVPASFFSSSVIRTVTTSVQGFYGAQGTQIDTVSQPVVKLPLLDTTTTRFGAGWQLAELQRLHLGQTFGPDEAIVWTTGDGSYAVFRKLAGVWTAPPGETARLADSVATAGLKARWVLSLDNGATVGFNADGRQRFTADLVGNQTVFGYDAASGRLLTITDPSGTRYEFTYGDETNAKGRVTEIGIRAVGAATPVRMATLGYVPGTGRLASVTIWRSETLGDVTRFGYQGNMTYGAYLDSIVDPRSTIDRPVVTTFTYDPVTGMPESQIRPPERLGQGIAVHRDPLRRAVPRLGWGRVSSDTAHPQPPLERLIYASQFMGTSVNFGGLATDFQTDAFGGPTYVRVIAPAADFSDPSTGGFYYNDHGGDAIRHIDRDAAGRVSKIVAGRERAASEAATDSVLYEYDALSRVIRLRKTTAAYPAAAGALDTVTFSYDSVTLAGGGWCSRLLKSQGVMGATDTTVIRYGATGAGRCLPAQTIGTAADSTIFTYGALTAGDVAGVRPVRVRDPNGLGESVTYDPVTWNTATHVRDADGATDRAYYGAFGQADSTKAPDGVVSRVLRDRSGRVTRQKTGIGVLAPTAATTYDPGGLVIQTDVYGALDGEIFGPAPPATPVQTTRSYYDRLGRADSIVGPGIRDGSGTPDQPRGRKQSYIYDRWGNPYFAYSGNGTYVGKLSDWQGRTADVDYSYVMPGLGTDREPFTDPATVTAYNTFPWSIGPTLSAGQVYRYVYDNRGRLTYEAGRDLYAGDPLYVRRRNYSNTGQLVGDTLTFMAGVTIQRWYQYNRRGQRTLAQDTVVATSVSGERGGRIQYFYDPVTGRLDSLVGTAGANRIGRVRWQYDRGGREILRGVRIDSTLAGHELVTTTTYDTRGRLAGIQTSSSQGVWYSVESPIYDAADRMTGYTSREAGLSPTQGNATFTLTNRYATDGTGRLLQADKWVGGVVGGSGFGNTYSYDVFGNRLTEIVARNAGLDNCTNNIQLSYGTDNRLYRRYGGAGCNVRRYWTDQAGNRIMETDSTGPNGSSIWQSVMSYTANNQLYFAFTPTASVSTWDVNWNWYDARGMRIISHVTNTSSTTTTIHPDQMGGIRNYYFYDGSDVALTLAYGGGGWSVQARYLSGGVDHPLLGRFSNLVGATRNLAPVGDLQGSTFLAVRADGTNEYQGAAGRDAFGRLMTNGTPPPGALFSATGYTGASTPHADGGFTYLRNRWYDPQTGRFLTQDPIGLAGGVNLYAYAGNNPIGFSDPFGLCYAGDGWADCDKMIDSKQSASILGAAIGSGEWTYSWGNTAQGEPAKSQADQIGECTDYVQSAVQTVLGDDWAGAGPNKSNTGMLLSEDNHPGYTRIDASMARPGDIVVQGSHAGVYAGGGKEGFSGAPKAYVNGGRPATSRKGYYDGKTHKVSMTRKDYGAPGPVYLRPIVEK